MNNTNEVQRWEKDFDEIFSDIDGELGDKGLWDGNVHYPYTIAIKGFVRELLASQEQRIWDMCEEMKWKAPLALKDAPNEYNKALSDLQAKLNMPKI